MVCSSHVGAWVIRCTISCTMLIRPIGTITRSPVIHIGSRMNETNQRERFDQARAIGMQRDPGGVRHTRIHYVRLDNISLFIITFQSIIICKCTTKHSTLNLTPFTPLNLTPFTPCALRASVARAAV